MKKAISVIAVIGVIIISCTKTGDAPDSNGGNNNPPPGGNTCDTTDMSYMGDIVPILQANCYTCHGTTTNSGSNGIVLEGYNNLLPKAQEGKLLGTITHSEGFTPMPQDGPKLSDCNINKFRSWINNGMQNN